MLAGLLTSRTTMNCINCKSQLAVISCVDCSRTQGPSFCKECSDQIHKHRLYQSHQPLETVIFCQTCDKKFPDRQNFDEFHSFPFNADHVSTSIPVDKPVPEENPDSECDDESGSDDDSESEDESDDDSDDDSDDCSESEPEPEPAPALEGRSLRQRKQVDYSAKIEIVEEDGVEMAKDVFVATAIVSEKDREDVFGIHSETIQAEETQEARLMKRLRNMHTMCRSADMTDEAQVHEAAQALRNLTRLLAQRGMTIDDLESNDQQGKKKNALEEFEGVVEIRHNIQDSRIAQNTPWISRLAQIIGDEFSIAKIWTREADVDTVVRITFVGDRRQVIYGLFSFEAMLNYGMVLYSAEREAKKGKKTVRRDDFLQGLFDGVSKELMNHSSSDPLTAETGAMTIYRSEAKEFALKLLDMWYANRKKLAGSTRKLDGEVYGQGVKRAGEMMPVVRSGQRARFE